MQSSNSKKTSKSITSIASCIVISLLISACSGGISGTGDGGPPTIVITDNDTGATDGADSDNGASNGGVSDSGSGTLDMTPPETTSDSDNVPQSPDTSQLIPSALQQLNALNENASAVQPLIAQLSLLQQDASAALSITSTVAGTVTANVSDAFDTTILYTLENTETVLANSSTSNLSYLFSTNTERTLYVLQQGRTLTVRHLNQSSNSLLQGRVISLADGSTIIEADLNQNGMQSYLQTYTDTSNTIVFAQHPTDATIAKQRELIDENGVILTIQNCTDVSQNCTLDSSWSNADATSNAQFSNARASIDQALTDSSLTETSTPAFTLPANINEAVLTQPTNEQPTDQQIQCGIQRVSDSVRTFCLIPQPLGPNSLFSETLAGSEIFYELIE